MKKAWVVAVNMGYGHQRAAFALKDIAKGKVLSANTYKGIPKLDQKVWEESRGLYEFISRFKKVPVLGTILFSFLNKVQEIKPFYPKRQALIAPTLQIRTIRKLIKNKEWGKHLVEKLNKEKLPFVTTFPIPAFMAEYWGYKGHIYLLATDSDAARAWAPLKPKQTRIKYLAPTQIVAERLTQYGIPEENIFYTGFPLPPELTNAKVAKADLKRRLDRLDPNREYITKYDDLIKEYLGSLPKKTNEPPTVTFAIGGAGAQQELGEQIIESLSPLIRERKLNLCMVAGTHADAAKKFTNKIKEVGLSEEVEVMFRKTKDEYFKDFTQTLRKTDILWTKPSEMSFYAALGIPLIITDPIGFQELRNKSWLLHIGSAVKQMKTEYANEWLMDLINDGSLAEAAMQGYVEMEKGGVKNIEKVVFEK